MNATERRRYPRYALAAPARLTSDGASFNGELKDICHDAVLVDSPRDCSLGSTVALSTEILANSGEVELTGRVVRVAPQERGRYDMAILFTALTPAAAIQIEFFLELQG